MLYLNYLFIYLWNLAYPHSSVQGVKTCRFLKGISLHFKNHYHFFNSVVLRFAVELWRKIFQKCWPSNSHQWRNVVCQKNEGKLNKKFLSASSLVCQCKRQKLINVFAFSERVFLSPHYAGSQVIFADNSVTSDRWQPSLTWAWVTLPKINHTTRWHPPLP